MEFRSVSFPEPRSFDSIKALVNNVAKEIEISYDVSFTIIKTGFKFDENDHPLNTEKVYSAAHASQVAFLSLLNCLAGLRHYFPDLECKILIVNTEAEQDPWLFFGLVLKIENELPSAEASGEFVRRFQKAQSLVGKQIRLYRQTLTTSYLQEIKDPSILIKS